MIVLLAIAILPALASEEEADWLSSTDDLQAGGEFADRSKLPGAALYQAHCASCHLGQVYKAPHQSWLEMMSQAALFNTMNEGMMAPQAAKLTKKQRIAVVEYLSSRRFSG